MSVAIGENHLKIVGKNYVIVTKLVDAIFPDYQRIISKTADKQAILNKELVKQVLLRTIILSNEKYHGVKLILENNKLIVESHNSEQEEAYEEIQISYNSSPLEIGFNANYLLEAINALHENEVIMSFADINSSVQIKTKHGESLYVVMPMRI